MRRARRVTVCLLLLHAVAGLWAQQSQPTAGSVDSSVTVLGRDDSVIAVPPPAPLDDPAGAAVPDRPPSLPGDETETTVSVPPVYPPLVELALPPAREALVLPDRLRLPLQ